jgi:uncharacterized protein (DUF302 family)
MGVQPTISYGRVVTTSLGQDDAIAFVKGALKDEGFGVLCEIDVAATLKEKTGADVPPYRILGSCNPQLAQQTLAREPQIGLLLPCNVVVQQGQGGTIVSAIDARAMLSVVENDELLSIADDVNARLARVLDKVAER